MNDETNEVVKRSMSWWMRLLLIAAMALSTWLFGLLLRSWGDPMPFVDAFTTMSSVIAMLISVWMFSEQWYIWVAVNTFSIYMWYCNFQAGNDNAATLLMWCVYLINSVIMLIKWEKEARKK